ncbi:YheC/YheD family protein [Mesobacillus zeae]|uniref:YheC/YheD family protein n=1 Tax=Mesobacillus zeae TaxID=1917180 RepID=A0A398BAD9_9BACI|nr:YheC/YheD family protein [Mesobacillus zeae]RID84643.1 YheC/YheD family protein [Mesobacillus zeae]
MKIYYDPWQERWFHQNNEHGALSFGAASSRLPCVRPLNESRLISYEVLLNEKSRNAGPIIGIMTAQKGEKGVAGNSSLFISLQKEAIKKSGLCVVFCPESVESHQISGYIFLPDPEKWAKVTTPLPHVVYNRVPFRKTEETSSFLKAAAVFKEWKIPFFNPSFLHKHELYQLFKKDSFLAPLMPETIKIESMEQLHDFLTSQKSVYLKPCLSSQGKGLYAVRIDGGLLEWSGHQSRKEYRSFEELWDNNSSLLLEKDYIAQSEISPDLLDGKRYDFRVHALDGPEGYTVTGVGIRLSQTQNLTTHIPNGGILIPYEPLRTRQHDRFFEKAVMAAGALISKNLGYFGEFSIDAGLTSSGNYVIYEINSKPMSFDEEHIEQKRVSLLTNLLFRKAGF